MILSNSGELLYNVDLNNQGETNGTFLYVERVNYKGNGNGAPAAPTVGDLDGDGELEIFVQTFEVCLL